MNNNEIDDQSDNEIETDTEVKKPLTPGKPTPLGMIPEFFIQYNDISQGIYDYSVIARKLIAMAMGLLPPDLSELTARFTFTDFCNALGIERSGDLYDRITKSIDECTKSDIKFETGKINKKGERIYKSFPWFSMAEIEEGTEIVIMKFNKDLVDYLFNLQYMFSKISLEDFGKLTSRYAIRYFEISMSFGGFKGKKGNKRDSWYFEYTIDDLKRKFMIKDDEYKRMFDLKKYAIENPLKELNNADVGLEITPEYTKTGKTVTKAKFNVKQTTKASSTASKKTKQADQSGVPEGIKDINNAMQQRELDDEIEKEYQEKYPEEFNHYVKEYTDNDPNKDKKLGTGLFTYKNAVGYAIKKLKERYEGKRGKGKKTVRC